MAGGGARPLQAVRAAAVRTAGAGPLPSVSRGTVRNHGHMLDTTPPPSSGERSVRRDRRRPDAARLRDRVHRSRGRPSPRPLPHSRSDRSRRRLRRRGHRSILGHVSVGETCGACVRMDAMTTRVDGLYVYPVKGTTPQPLPRIALTTGRGVPFDRTLALARPGGAYSPGSGTGSPSASTSSSSPRPASPV